VLAYGCSVDVVDDYVHIREDTILEVVQRYTKAVISIFGSEYLRAPTDEYTKRFLALSEERGWLEMLGSIDCITGHGRIVLHNENDSTKATTKIQQPFLGCFIRGSMDLVFILCIA